MLNRLRPGIYDKSKLGHVLLKGFEEMIIFSISPEEKTRIRLSTYTYVYKITVKCKYLEKDHGLISGYSGIWYSISEKHRDRRSYLDRIISPFTFLKELSTS